MSAASEQSPRIRVGLIGAGYMSEEYCKVLRDHPNYELVGLVSQTKEKSIALGTKYGLSFFPRNWRELSDLVAPDLMIVAVSEHATQAVVNEAIGFPGVILVEKPLGLTLEEARNLHHLSMEAGKSIFVGLNRRFYASTMRLQVELEQVGGNRFLLLQDQHDIIAARRARYDERTVQNWMFANAIHTVDLLNFRAVVTRL